MEKLSQRYVAGKGIYQIHEERDCEAAGSERIIIKISASYIQINV